MSVRGYRVKKIDHVEHDSLPTNYFDQLNMLEAYGALDVSGLNDDYCGLAFIVVEYFEDFADKEWPSLKLKKDMHFIEGMEDIISRVRKDILEVIREEDDDEPYSIRYYFF